MNQTILFRFISSAEVEWLLEGASPERGTPEALAAQAAGRRLVLVASGEAVTLTRTKVASRHRATLLQAIPYALEDSLADDVEDLHFAIGPVKDGEIPVAVIRHEVLKSWLDDCAEAGITPVAVVPAPLLLPYEDGAWSVLVEDEHALVRSGPWTGFATDRENLGLLLGFALSEAGEQRPHSLRVWGEGALELADSTIEVHHQDNPREPLEIYFAGYRNHDTLNLLQGPYSHKSQLGRWLRPWRAAAILAGLWLGLQLSFPIVEYWRLSQAQETLQAEMERLYREAVPDARRIVNPRVQLEHRLQELREAAGGGGEEGEFLELLYQGGQILAGFDEVSLRGLRYQEDQLDIDLEGGSLETLDRLKQQLTEHPELQVEMRTTKRGDRVESQLMLRKISL